ncbi:MAG: hypothetical protein E7478_04160 [Ruminococcaceae bacterium]|nr:hypothetical protein [Oscillospiraceae bacterium]
MKIILTLIKKNDKFKIAATFETDTIGKFIVDTAYDTADNILKQCMDINKEFGGFCPVFLNTNGAIIIDQNNIDILTRKDDSDVTS